MEDYKVVLSEPVNETLLADLNIVQGYNYLGLEISWEGKIVKLKNVSTVGHIPGIQKAFKNNAKFITSYMCEIHSCNGRLKVNDNTIYAYFGSHGLVAVDKNGTIAWHNDLGAVDTLHGTACSPLLY